MESTLVGVLKADPTVAGLFGSRLYPMRLPDTLDLSKEESFPALAYSVVSDLEMYEVSVGLTTVQFTVFAKTYKQGKTAKDAVIKALHRYKGGDLQSVSYMNGLEIDDPNVGLKQFTLDFRVKHTKKEV